MNERPRIRLGRVRRKVAADGAVSYALPLTRAGLEDAARAASGWPLVRIAIFPVTKGPQPELVAYLEPRLREDFELETGDR